MAFSSTLPASYRLQSLGLQLPLRRLQSKSCVCEARQSKGSGSSKAAEPAPAGNNVHPMRGVLLVSAVACSAVAFAAPAQARSRGWHPRRHHRRLGRDEWTAEVSWATQEQESEPSRPPARQEPPQAAAATSSLEGAIEHTAAAVQEQVTEVAAYAGEGLSELWHEAQRYYSKAERAVRKAIGADGGFTVSEMAAPTPSRTPQALLAAQEGLGWTAVAVAAVSLLLWLLRRSWRGGRERRVLGGRWVKDRSLGGKLVFVADGEGERPAKSLWGDEAPSTSSTAAASPPAGGTAELAWQRRPQPEEPSWWSPPRRPPYVSPATQDQAKREAKKLLRMLEDMKLAGRMYDIQVLLALHVTCRDAAVSVSPRTEAGRDAVLRAAVAAAVQAAMDGDGGQLRAEPPATFASGLALDLGVPQKRAIQIIHAEVAATARSSIIDACAAHRAGDRNDEMVQLLRLAGLMDKFPLPPGSPEAELIATAIQQRCTLEERQAVFFTYGAMEPGTADLVAEMLGFNPDLVMPQLIARQQRR